MQYSHVDILCITNILLLRFCFWIPTYVLCAYTYDILPILKKKVDDLNVEEAIFSEEKVHFNVFKTHKFF